MIGMILQGICSEWAAKLDDEPSDSTIMVDIFAESMGRSPKNDAELERFINLFRLAEESNVSWKEVL